MEPYWIEIWHGHMVDRHGVVQLSAQHGRTALGSKCWGRVGLCLRLHHFVRLLAVRYQRLHLSVALAPLVTAVSTLVVLGQVHRPRFALAAALLILMLSPPTVHADGDQRQDQHGSR